MKLHLVLIGVVFMLAIGGCTAKEWEYKSETVTYSDKCLAEAVKPFSSDETIQLSVQIAQRDSALALSRHPADALLQRESVPRQGTKDRQRLRDLRGQV